MSVDLARQFQGYVAGDPGALDGVTERDCFDPASPAIPAMLSQVGIETVQARLLPLVLAGGPASLRAYELLAGYYFAWGEWDLFHQLTVAFLPRLEAILGDRRMAEDRFTAWADAAIQIGYLSVAVNFQKLNSARDFEIERLDHIYTMIAERLSRRTCRVVAREAGGPPRIAHCVDFVNSLNNAIVKEVDTILECSSADQRLYILSTELCSSANRAPLSVFRFASHPSATTGRALLAKWAAAGRDIRIFAEPDSYCERIVAMHRFIKEEGIQTVFYHTGIASGMACVLSYLRPAPVQLNVHQGLPMFSRAIAATRFWVRGQAERYGRYFDGSHTAFVMPAILRFAPRSRTVARRATDGVCIATAGNRLPVMMDEAFVGLISRLLKRFPSARFEAFGLGEFSAVAERFARCGVAADRVCFRGHAEDLTAALAACDVFINTMTRGGGLVPAQAIMAGIPAVNIATVENGYPPDGTRFIDAQYLPADLDAMETFAVRLIADAEYRDRVAREQLERLRSLHAPAKTVPIYERLATCLRAGPEPRPAVEGIEWLT